MEVEEQVVIIFAATNGFVDDVPVEAVGKFEKELIEYVKLKSPKLLPEIAAKKEVTDETRKTLETTIQDFLKTFKYKED